MRRNGSTPGQKNWKIPAKQETGGGTRIADFLVLCAREGVSREGRWDIGSN